MTPERWQRVQDLVHQALDLPPASRPAFLAEACGADSELHRLAHDLIASDEEAGTFIEGAIRAGAASALAAADAPELPSHLGRYRILRLLGQGGMGSVYEAEQEHPRRRVALKVIRPGLLAPGLLRRFEREADALGRVHHPGIAEIYEAGTAGGQPYFAMELVEGQDLLRYTRDHALDLRHKLALMISVCRAVHHAHQRGIIHRDLKPGNILVDAAGQPKILDFGLARLAGQEEQLTRQTDLGQLLGTLNYMSPEQLSGDPAAVDFRSDVYSLGVILYELLAGRLPVDTRGKPVHEALVELREAEPASLLTVSRVFRGDIETIAGRAMEKDQQRRYASAADLADDLERYLHHQPIHARPPSTAYQVAKFARRHRALVAGLAAVFATLTAGVVTSTWQALRATRAEQAALTERDRAREAGRQTAIERDRALSAERRAAAERDRALLAEQNSERARQLAVAERSRADTEAATSRAVSDFLRNDLLGQASAIAQATRSATPTRDLKVREALDRAAAEVGSRFAQQPAIEAAIRHTIGSAYHDLGLYAEARTHWQRAFELFRRQHGGQHPDTLNALHSLANVSRAQGQFPEAAQLYAQAAAARRRMLGAGHPDTLRSLHGVAITLRSQGKNEEAIRVHEDVLARRRATLGAEHPDTLRSLNDLAVAHIYSGQFQTGLELASEAYRVRSRILGPGHPDTAVSLHALGMAQYNSGKTDEASATFEKGLALHEKIYGPDHPETINSLGMLGNTFTSRARFPEARQAFEQAVERGLRVWGERHASTLTWMGNAGNSLADEGKFNEGAALLRRTLDLTIELRGPEHADTQRLYNNLARALLAAGRLDEAIATGRTGIAIRRRLRGTAHSLTIITSLVVGDALGRQGRAAEAEALFREIIAEGERTGANVDRAREALAHALLRQSRYGEAETVARACLAKLPPNGGRRAATVRAMLGAALAGQNKSAPAEEHLLSGYQTLHQARNAIPAPDRQFLQEVQRWLAAFYESEGRGERAAAYRER